MVFEIKGYDLSTAKVFVSIRRGQDILTKTDPDVQTGYDAESEISTVVCSLTQEETLAIRQGDAIAQIRFIYEDGQAYATDKASIEVKDVIYKEVISYGGEGE